MRYEETALIELHRQGAFYVEGHGSKGCPSNLRASRSIAFHLVLLRLPPSMYPPPGSLLIWIEWSGVKGLWRTTTSRTAPIQSKGEIPKPAADWFVKMKEAWAVGRAKARVDPGPSDLTKAVREEAEDRVRWEARAWR